MSHRPSNEPTALYRLYDANGNLLYLGISWNPDARMQLHARDKHWLHLVARRTVEWHPDRASALAAEAAATAVEKPLHDSSWRKTGGGERPQWLDPEGQKKVENELAAEIEGGRHWRGKCLMTGAVAKKYNVSRTTAASAMGVLQERGLLERWHYGRFSVLKGPAKEDFEKQVLEKELAEARRERRLLRAYQIWTAAELREALKDLPDDTPISARLSS